jgi:hypothetical protein
MEQTEELADFIDMSSDDSESCEEDFTIPEPVEKRQPKALEMADLE